MEALPGPLDTGQTLAGLYSVDGLIDTGGFAVVYHGHRLVDKLPVAIKALRIDVANSDPAAVERFVREAAIAAHLQHPNLVRIVDFGKTPEDVLYMIMEHLHGEPLFVHLLDEPWEPRRVHHLLHQLLDALAFAHGQGLIHRDLKPSNVFLSKIVGSSDPNRSEWLKVMDFGLAKGLRKHDKVDTAMKITLTLSGERVGSPGYMAPETFKSDAQPTPLVDLYVAGILGYEMLTGIMAFPGDGMQRAIAQLESDPPEPPNFIGEHPLYAVIQRLIERDPGQRFQSADEALAALNRVESTQGTLWM